MEFVLDKCGHQPELPDVPWHDDNQEPSFGQGLTASQGDSDDFLDQAKAASKTSIQYTDDIIGSRLMLAKRQARLREMRLRGPPLACAVTVGVFGMVLQWRITYAKSTPLIQFLVNWCVALFGFATLLTLLPGDRKAVKLYAVFSIPFVLGFVVVKVRQLMQVVHDDNCVVSDNGDDVPCWFAAIFSVSDYLSILSCVCVIVGISCALAQGLPANLLLPRLYSITGCNFIVLSLVSIVRATAANFADLMVFAYNSYASAFGYAVSGYACIYGIDLRNRMQSWLMSRGQAAITAAGISELLGGQSIDGTLGSARNTFFFVPANRLTREDMADNCPNPALAGLTEKGRLGAVDAFVSHSWHDNAAAKWAGLQELRNTFKDRHSREPTFWIDKYCINQNKIDVSLSCLPVYLSGCKELWILCGKTYLERLWCIMEILVFIEMGGQLSQLQVKLLGEETNEETSNGEVVQSIATLQTKASLLENLMVFDARKATCTTRHDTEKLQAVLHATGHEQITKLIHDVFKP